MAFLIDELRLQLLDPEYLLGVGHQFPELLIALAPFGLLLVRRHPVGSRAFVLLSVLFSVYCMRKRRLVKRLHAAAQKILRHTGLWRDTPPRAPPATTPEALGVSQDKHVSRPGFPKSQIRIPKVEIVPAACQPELFCITDDDCQAFPDLGIGV